MRYPKNNRWTQENHGDKFGSLSYTRNINLEKDGYLKLSLRAINFFDDDGNVSNVSDDDFGIPVAFGRFYDGNYTLATVDDPFTIEISDTDKAIAEDVSANNPGLTFDSHGCWFNGKFHMSTSTAVSANDSGTWTSNVITGLTTSFRHCLESFKNKRSLCVSDGNLVKLYNTSYTLITTLTLPADYEVIGLAYNNSKMGIITRLGSTSEGQNSNCYFFTWNGATTEAEGGFDMGSYTSVCVFPYQSSFVALDSLGRLRYWNGGSFEPLASFPFYLDENRWGDLLNFLSYGNNIVVDGDVIVINVGFDFSPVGLKQEFTNIQSPSGIWCYDPSVGLYHRTSPSISKVYRHQITEANMNTSTDIFTTSVTIPDTGNPLILTNGQIGGLNLAQVYYVIKLSSTTFAIAETKEKAVEGVKVDITGTDAVGYFFLYDIVDYGATDTDVAGAVTLHDRTKIAYKDFFFGGRYYDTLLDSVSVLCSNVPFLENRGAFILSREFFDEKLVTTQAIRIKHQPLGVNDKIIVRVKNRKIFGLPITSPNLSAIVDEFTWSGKREGYTNSNISEAYTYFNASQGNELTMEFTAGVGAGQIVKVTDIIYSGGSYYLTFEEDVVGARSTLQSHFILDNWTYHGEVNQSNQKIEGYYDFTVGKVSTALEVQVELRGYNVTIADIEVVQAEHSK